MDSKERPTSENVQPQASGEVVIEDIQPVDVLQKEPQPSAVDGSGPLVANEDNSETVAIDITNRILEKPRFPAEKLKTLLALFFLIVSTVVTSISLAYIHEKVPDQEKVEPLPDIVLDNITNADWALDVSEVIIMVSLLTAVVVMILHKHRFIVLRRAFLILGILYLMRAVTMFVTVLPVANPSYYCSPKDNTTSTSVIAERVLQLVSGFGLSINGQHTFCGDYIFSGHTVALTLSYLIITEYSPKRYRLLHWLSWLMSIVGVLLVLVARGHYTIDVIVAYYVTTNLFWTFHMMANNTNLKKNGTINFFSKLWWFPLFHYFEVNIPGPVPLEHNWPLPWPTRFK